MSHADEAVDPVVRKAAAWSWRLLAIFGAVLALLWVVIKLEVIVVPVLLATLAAAFLLPAVDLLTRRGLPRGAAVAAMLLSSIVVMGGILSSTALTLLVLPVLYRWACRGEGREALAEEQADDLADPVADAWPHQGGSGRERAEGGAAPEGHRLAGLERPAAPGAGGPGR